MTADSGTTPRRRGRPPAAAAGATRDRILRAARHAFAEHGYAATSNRILADEADVTTGAIYHYFDAKLDLYRAVNDVAQSTVYERFEAAVDAALSLVDGIERVLDVAHELNNHEPSLARFLGAARIDVRRNPELRSTFTPSTIRREQFIERLVGVGVASGELDPAHRDPTVAMIRAVLIGLVDAVSDDPVEHRAAIDALKLLVEGRLIRRGVADSPAR
ncbi:MAG: helix-turn-helix domain-containing protein [Ilumatobacteraceae bacterium]